MVYLNTPPFCFSFTLILSTAYFSFPLPWVSFGHLLASPSRSSRRPTPHLAPPARPSLLRLDLPRAAHPASPSKLRPRPCNHALSLRLSCCCAIVMLLCCCREQPRPAPLGLPRALTIAYGCSCHCCCRRVLAPASIALLRHPSERLYCLAAFRVPHRSTSSLVAPTPSCVALVLPEPFPSAAER